MHGVLLLDKPLRLSSNEALQKAKWLLRAEKAGHTGTLDPMASGLLPLCFGAATKFSQVSLDADKAYEAVVQLGVRTSTGDSEGEVLERRDVAVDDAQIEAVRGAFVGEISQIPPMHSALKKDGRPLYEYAREGLDLDRVARQVQIHQLQARRDPQDASRLLLSVRCSKGTYIRTLAEDIGQHLGCGASLAALRRTGSGGLTLASSVTLEQLESMTELERMACLQPVDALLTAWPAVHLNEHDAARFLSGMRRRIDGLAGPSASSQRVRVYGPPTTHPVLLGSAHVAGGELIPDRLLSPPEVQALTPAVTA